MNTSRTFALRFPCSKERQFWLVALASCAALLLLTSTVHAADAATVDRTTFDHLTTGFELTGQHRDLPCESCHVNAIFKGTPKDCAACHGVGTAVRATAKPVTHILSTNKCEACHTPVAWNPAVNFDHAEVIGGCFTCHNGVQAQGQGPNHIETNADCGKCHTTISWAGAVFNHPQVVDGCSTCHSPGGGATSLPPTHIPTDDAMGPSCAGCHAPTQYTTFSGANMNHLVVTSIRCDACHEAGMSFIGTTIVTRPPLPHPIVGSGDCSACHFDTVSFKSGNLMPANHIPTTQPCTLCHSNPADYSIYVMDHAGIANGCAACHAAGKSFANMAPPVLKVPPSDHIAFAGAACEACHAATDFTSFMFTNASGAAPPAMIHSAVAGLRCDTCHGSGLSFAGAPPTVTIPANHVPIGAADCGTCHSPNTFASFVFTNASGTAPPAMVHSAVTSLACSTCHEKGLSWAGLPSTVLRPINEASGAVHPTMGECSDCHQSFTTFKGASNYPANHIPLLNGQSTNCTTCHTDPNSLSLYTMDHSQVTAVCETCHASGKSFTNMAPPALKVPPANHVPFGAAACATCHSAANFASFQFANVSGAAPPSMVHSGVAGVACATCHGVGKTWVGAPATVLPPNDHIPFGAASCESCHAAGNFTTFTIANAVPPMNHAVVSSIACSTCHGAGKTWRGAPATKILPGNHVPVGGADCSACHSPNNFASFIFTNASGTAPPSMVHTAVSSIVCSACHEKGLTWAGVPTTVLRPVLEASGATHPTTGECSDCHKSTTTFKGATNYPADHIPLTNGSSANCSACHANPNNFGLYTMDHSLVTTVCETCHASGRSFANIASPALKQPPANHVPFGSAGCSTCHSAGNFTSFQFTNATGTAPPAMVHGVVAATACSACHEVGRSWVGAPATKLRPALKADGPAHVAAGECSTCHFDTVSFKGASDLPANHIPLPAADNNNCALCHTTPGNYSLAVMSHANIASNCAQCHAAGRSFANMAPPTLVLPPANHVPFGTAACESCHSPTVFTSFKFTNASGAAPSAMVHAVVPGVACAVCHGTGKAWVGTPATVVPPAKHIPFGTAACETCHVATDFTTFVVSNKSPPMNHAVVSSIACGTCHGRGLTWSGTPITVVEPANHIPIGTTVCTQCHTATNFTSFAISNVSGTAAPSMVHTGFTTNCITCHGAGLTFVGTPATKVFPANHIPTATIACEGCHSNSVFTTFVFANKSGTSPSAMVHSTVTSIACSACHEAGKSWAGTPATVLRPAKKANGSTHVATGECSSCHLNTTSFKGAVDYPPDHIPNPGGAASNCNSCHTTGVFSAYVMSHAGITNGCKTCHGYNHATFAGVWTKALTVPPAGPSGHIPTNPPNSTTRDITCESCHSASVFTTFAGTVMRHAFVTTMQCMACHERGMTWKTNTGVRLWVRPSANHYAGIDCTTGCHEHSARDKRAVRRTAGAASGAVARASTGIGAATALSRSAAGFDHRRVAAATCVSCHGPTSGSGKPAGHIATSDRCESCHNTVAWLPVTLVDHTQVTGTCVSCHNGTVAKTKGKNHIASSNSCETCHTTNAWTPARFDHVGVVAHTCKTCHDSLHATGLPADHVPTAAQCDTCHGTLAWKPAKLDHTTLIANCVSCHNNTIALGVPAVHMSTQRDCATCHSYSDWTVLHFVHVSAAYPGEHKAVLACAACHTSNTDQIPWASSADKGSCAGCHAKDFKPDRHPKISGGAMYTASELHDCSGACHVYSDATLGKTVKSVPGPYHRVSDVAFKH